LFANFLANNKLTFLKILIYFFCFKLILNKRLYYRLYTDILNKSLCLHLLFFVADKDIRKSFIKNQDNRIVALRRYKRAICAIQLQNVRERELLTPFDIHE